MWKLFGAGQEESYVYATSPHNNISTTVTLKFPGVYEVHVFAPVLVDTIICNTIQEAKRKAEYAVDWYSHNSKARENMRTAMAKALVSK